DDMEASEKIRIYDKGFDVTAAEFVSEAESLRLRNGDILIPRIPDAEPLHLECEAFIHAICTGVPPRSDGRDGLRVVRVLEAAHRSLKSGGYPVSVSSSPHGDLV